MVWKKKSSGAGFLSSLQYVASDICWECFNFWHQVLVGQSYRGRTEQSGGNHHRCHQTASVWTDRKDLFKSQSVHEAENISSDPRHQLFYLRLKCYLQTTAKGWNPAIEIWTVNSSLMFIFFCSVSLSAGLVSGQWYLIYLIHIMSWVTPCKCVECIVFCIVSAYLHLHHWCTFDWQVISPWNNEVPAGANLNWFWLAIIHVKRLWFVLYCYWMTLELFWNIWNDSHASLKEICDLIYFNSIWCFKV